MGLTLSFLCWICFKLIDSSVSASYENHNFTQATSSWDSTINSKQIQHKEDKVSLIWIAEPDVDINPTQKAIQHLTKVAIENHTCITGFHWRYGFHMDEFYDKLLAPNFDNNWSMKIFRYLQPKGT